MSQHKLSISSVVILRVRGACEASTIKVSNVWLEAGKRESLLEASLFMQNSTLASSNLPQRDCKSNRF